VFLWSSDLVLLFEVCGKCEICEKGVVGQSYLLFLLLLDQIMELKYYNKGTESCMFCSHLPLFVCARPLPVPIETTSIGHRS